MKPTIKLMTALGVGSAAATLAYARWVERLWIDVQRLWVTVDSPGTPPGGLRILHFSDMHFTGEGTIERLKIERTVKLLAGESIDLMLVTGDFIHDDGGMDAALELIRRLPRPRLGTFACLGNHDYASYSWLGPARVAWREAEPGQELRAAAKRTVEMVKRVVTNDRLYLGEHNNDMATFRGLLANEGIQLLDNSSCRVQIDGVDLWLAGVDDLMEGRPDVPATLAGMPHDGALRILLAHNPDLMLDAALQQVDLALCGHVHGGQIRLPLLGSPHTQGTHLSRRRSSGWFQYGRAATYIGRGLGEGIRLRFNCRPEVALIHVLPG
ncbi:MAG TPA: metallophosphoesterase [Anaerolineae bacterium]|nr:metallophosphoesterase [Anaerolineae bacterium]